MSASSAAQSRGTARRLLVLGLACLVLPTVSQAQVDRTCYTSPESVSTLIGKTRPLRNQNNFVNSGAQLNIKCFNLISSGCSGSSSSVFLEFFESITAGSFTTYRSTPTAVFPLSDPLWGSLAELHLYFSVAGIFEVREREGKTVSSAACAKVGQYAITTKITDSAVLPSFVVEGLCPSVATLGSSPSFYINVFDQALFFYTETNCPARARGTRKSDNKRSSITLAVPANEGSPDNICAKTANTAQTEVSSSNQVMYLDTSTGFFELAATGTGTITLLYTIYHSSVTATSQVKLIESGACSAAAMAITGTSDQLVTVTTPIGQPQQNTVSFSVASNVSYKSAIVCLLHTTNVWKALTNLSVERPNIQKFVKCGFTACDDLLQCQSNSDSNGGPVVSNIVEDPTGSNDNSNTQSGSSNNLDAKKIIGIFFGIVAALALIALIIVVAICIDRRLRFKKRGFVPYDEFVNARLQRNIEMIHLSPQDVEQNNMAGMLAS